jgi:hypothetical protein
MARFPRVLEIVAASDGFSGPLNYPRGNCPTPLGVAQSNRGRRWFQPITPSTVTMRSSTAWVSPSLAAVGSDGTPGAPTPPGCEECEASQLCSDDLLEDVAVQCQVRDHLFELAVSWRSDRSSRSSRRPSPPRRIPARLEGLDATVTRKST